MAEYGIGLVSRAWSSSRPFTSQLPSEPDVQLRCYHYYYYYYSPKNNNDNINNNSNKNNST